MLYNPELTWCEIPAWFHLLSALLLGFTLMACTTKQGSAVEDEVAVHKVEIHGHRGARGLMPENTIPAMVKAMELGVDALEFDVVISGDSQVIVSHEAFMSHEMCLDPDGHPIAKEEEKSHNLFEMDYATIKSYDCGSHPHPRFPGQEKLATFKPRLIDLIDTMEQWAKDHNSSLPFYSIEVKSITEEEGLFQPPAAEFAKLVLEVLKAKSVMDRSNIQSFDIHVLEACYQQAPDFPLVYLIESERDFKLNMEKISFVPDTYGPDFKLVNAELIAYAKEVGMKVIPWTVNEEEDIKRMVDLGVNGVVTDYPDRAVKLLR